MPRFLFHVRGARQELSCDEVGLDFPDVETAYRETFCAAQDIRAVIAACGRHPCDYVIEVVNVAHELVFRLPFSEALDHRVPGLTKRFRQ
jgi:hypothetical protein